MYIKYHNEVKNDIEDIKRSATSDSKSNKPTRPLSGSVNKTILFHLIRQKLSVFKLNCYFSLPFLRPCGMGWIE